jgi:hypothetical protein
MILACDALYRAVLRRQAGSFTVHLTRAVQNSISFTYLVVEPFS